MDYQIEVKEAAANSAFVAAQFIGQAVMQNHWPAQ
jgi:hypothetical protein